MEIAVEGAQLDGMICLSSCDKTPPAHLMAAGRFNIPTILVICGYQPCGQLDGESVDIEDVFVGGVQVAFGKLDADRLRAMADNAIRGPGRVPGDGDRQLDARRRRGARDGAARAAAPVRANSPKMIDLARRSGQRIVEMVLEDLKPRDVMTAGAFRNAAAAVLAVSGSINCIKHLQATAIESGLDLDVYGLFNELGDDVPVLSAVRPNGEDSIEQFEDAGGAHALLKQLEPVLDTGAMTVTGATVADNLAAAVVLDDEVIRPLDRPFSDKPAIVVLHGSLAPESAILKLGVREPGRQSALHRAGDRLRRRRRGDGRHPGRDRQARPRARRARHGPQGRPGHGRPCVDDPLRGRLGRPGDRRRLRDRRPALGPVPEGDHGGRGLARGRGRRPARARARTATRSRSTPTRARWTSTSPRTSWPRRREALGVPELPRARGYLSIYQRSVQPMSTGAVLVEND